MASGPSTIIQHVKAGRLRVLASWGDKRLVSLPDVPTLAESGFDAMFFQWAGVFVPAGTPEPIVAKLREAARAASSDPAFVSALGTVQTPVRNSYLRKGWVEVQDGDSSSISDSDEQAFKKCPFCTELVRREAIKCKHCGSALELTFAPNSGSTETYPPVQVARSGRRH